ncbi:hypothetical protein PV797_04875 [Clostridiaceae bacterium M8S5]|nr:hypothetical protein PV797_04875 [Clostridiaceae bacterium M8S5]
MTTLIGLNSYGDGSVFDPATAPICNINDIKIKNAVFDEVGLFDGSGDSANERSKWSSHTVFIAKLKDNLEAGNISLDEHDISGLKVKRKKSESNTYVDLATVNYVPNSMMTYLDYFASSNTDYDYAVVPVSTSGIEGIINITPTKPMFDGWWLIDCDDPDKNHFHFYYNLKDVNISTHQDRTVLNTFSKYPKVYYGQKYAKHGSLSGLLLPDDGNVVTQLRKLEDMINKHKPLLLKDSMGRCFYVDVSAPSMVAMQRPNDISSISINWVEVREYHD